MDKLFYRKLLIMVNDTAHMELLHSYVAGRMEILRGQLETAKDMDRVRQIQGSIQELKRFKTIREEVVKESE